MLMAMEIFLACSSWANSAALFAESFFPLSALPLVSIWRQSTSAAHCALDRPGGRSFGARGFLAFGGMVVDEKTRRRMEMPIHKFGGREWGYASKLEGNRQDLAFLSPTTRVHTTFRAQFFHPESPSAPRGTGDGVGSPDG